MCEYFSMMCMSYTFAFFFKRLFVPDSWNVYIGSTTIINILHIMVPQTLKVWCIDVCVFPYSFIYSPEFIPMVLSVYGGKSWFFTYPVTPQLLIPNGQGLRLSTFWLSLRWEQKENHINNRSVEKNVGWTHLFAVGGWKLIVFLKWRSSFLLCFFVWAGLHGYTLFDGWYRYGIDGANWQKNYCNFLEVFFCFVLRKGCF